MTSDELTKELRHMLDVCPKISFVLLDEKSKAYDDFDELWSGITRLYESLVNQEENT